MSSQWMSSGLTITLGILAIGTILGKPIRVHSRDSDQESIGSKIKSFGTSTGAILPDTGVLLGKEV